MAVLFVDFVSCSKNNINNGNSLILGQWHFSSGSACEFIGDSIGSIYDQILTFTSAGNYSEENISATKDEIDNGNWSIQNNKITINNWEGKKLDNPISIISLSENQLEISYLNYTAVYLRVGTEFENLSSIILGYWYGFVTNTSNTRNYYAFTNDGIVTQVTYPFTDSNVITQQGQYEWSIDGNLLFLTYLPTHYKTGVDTIKFCNDKYMRWKSNNSTIDLSRNRN